MFASFEIINADKIVDVLVKHGLRKEGFLQEGFDEESAKFVLSWLESLGVIGYDLQLTVALPDAIKAIEACECRRWHTPEAKARYELENFDEDIRYSFSYISNAIAGGLNPFEDGTRFALWDVDGFPTGKTLYWYDGSLWVEGVIAKWVP